MNRPIPRSILLISICVLLALSCQMFGLPPGTTTSAPTRTPVPLPTASPTPLLAPPVQPGTANPEEPVFITGDIPYTSPFFLESASEPFVMLEDEAGFVHRDKEFVFRPEEQAIGPAVLQPDSKLTYSLALPSVPQGTFVDVDNNGQADKGDPGICSSLLVQYMGRTLPGNQGRQGLVECLYLCYRRP